MKLFKIDILCLRGKGELEKRIMNKDVNVIYFENGSSTILKNIYDVWRVCRNYKYNIVHAHGWATLLPGYIGARLAGIKTIINGEHGTLYYDSLKRRIIQKILFGLVKLNITVSRALKNEIIKKFKIRDNNFYTIQNGVDTRKFFPSTEIRNNKRNQLRLNLNCFVVGSVGRLVQVKDYPSLIKAFSIFSHGKESTKLVLVGNGAELEDLKDLSDRICKKGTVVFLGERADIPELYNTFDLFFLTSLREGLSNTVLEAMACGIPTIVTMVGGNPEIVKEGITGILIKAGDVEQMVNIMEDLYNNPNRIRRMSSEARQHICDKLSIENMVRDYENVYKNVINKIQFN